VIDSKRRFFATAYNIAGATMIVVPAIVAALGFAGGPLATHWIFWAEVWGIWSFAAYWFLKTAEYRLLLRIKWFA
jgi:hypothetical protein